jgi:hypothetical protein
MRLTYRTVRVLAAVAELSALGSPPSNREVGLAAGMRDQGQISKLLTRLHGLGLIENTDAGLARGAPNAWMLTAKGREIEQAVGQSAENNRRASDHTSPKAGHTADSGATALPSALVLGPTRPVPHVGAPARIKHFGGGVEHAIVIAIHDDGSRLSIEGEDGESYEFVLSPSSARFVTAGNAHGPRLELVGGDG